jgi:hypothetical protein
MLVGLHFLPIKSITSVCSQKCFKIAVAAKFVDQKKRRFVETKPDQREDVRVSLGRRGRAHDGRGSSFLEEKVSFAHLRLVSKLLNNYHVGFSSEIIKDQTHHRNLNEMNILVASHFKQQIHGIEVMRLNLSDPLVSFLANVLTLVF